MTFDVLGGGEGLLGGLELVDALNHRLPRHGAGPDGGGGGGGGGGECRLHAPARGRVHSPPELHPL